MAESYRQNVAALIVNKEKKVLMCEHAWIDDAWQLPQGGVEEGEEDDSAILRELEEELGSNKFKIIARMEKPIRYKYPYYLKEKFHSEGQEQRYYLVYFQGDDSEIRFDNQEKPEFKSFQWVDFEAPPKMVIYFKKLVYLQAVEYFKDALEKFDPKKA
jgi:putative (di)nucleoside polyphosphate hydrolase